VDLSICADLKTPSSGMQSNLNYLGLLRYGHSIKAVIKTHEDLEYAVKHFRDLSNIGVDAEFMLSIENAQFVPEILCYNDLDFRVTMQIHKILGLR
jgi:hypothetical protein